MTIYILTEGGFNVGYGHIARCTALYEAFKNHNHSVYLYINGENIQNINKNYDVQNFNWIDKYTHLLVKTYRPDAIIIDSYKADLITYNKISELTSLSLFIDDTNRINYPKGIIINGSIFAEDINYCQENHLFLTGIKYIPLRKEFWKIPIRSVNKKIKKILLTIGGSDMRNLTPGILNLLINKFPSLTMNVVIGFAFKNIKMIDRFNNKNINYIYHPDAKEMKDIILNSDIAISAGGQTLYELARCGIPTIAISTANNQKNNITGWLKAGFIEFAGWCEDKDLLVNLLNKIDILKDLHERKKRSALAKKLVDGKGGERIVSWVEQQF